MTNTDSNRQSSHPNLNPETRPPTSTPTRPTDRRRPTPLTLAQRIVARAYLLPQPDRDLIQAVYESGLTASHFARMRNEDPRLTQARLRSLLRLIASPRYEFLFAHRRDLPDTHRQLATLCIAHRTPIRTAAKQLHLSYSNARAILLAIDHIAIPRTTRN